MTWSKAFFKDWYKYYDTYSPCVFNTCLILHIILHYGPRAPHPSNPCWNLFDLSNGDFTSHDIYCLIHFHWLTMYHMCIEHTWWLYITTSSHFTLVIIKALKHIKIDGVAPSVAYPPRWISTNWTNLFTLT